MSQCQNKYSRELCPSQLRQQWHDVHNGHFRIFMFGRWHLQFENSNLNPLCAVISWSPFHKTDLLLIQSP